jgi:hypothetical protein
MSPQLTPIPRGVWEFYYCPEQKLPFRMGRLSWYFATMCGARADRIDRLCRIYGRMINRPSMFWRVGQNTYLPGKQRVGVESEARRLGNETIENQSAIDTQTIATPKVVVASGSGEVLAQTEEIYAENAIGLESSLLKEENPVVSTKELEKPMVQARTWKRLRSSTIAGYVMIIAGVLALVFSVVSVSTILVFMGLGLTFWGALLLFIRPQKYVRSVLMDSTAFSSLRTIDRIMTELGYYEKGTYIPSGNSERVVAYVPAEPFGRIPKASEIEDQTFIERPKGIAMIPPGLALANLIEKRLNEDLKKCSLESLSERLPKLLVEDLEIAQNFEMHVNGDEVRFRFDESVYSDFCHRLGTSTRVCAGLGCPICSAMACVLAIATGRPVSFDGDKHSADGKSFESTYHLLEA